MIKVYLIQLYLLYCRGVISLNKLKYNSKVYSTAIGILQTCCLNILLLILLLFCTLVSIYSYLLIKYTIHSSLDITTLVENPN